MSISSRISSMEEHVTNAYNGLQGLGADLTGIDKNIDNIAQVLDDLYNDLPKVTDEDTSITLDNTRVGRLATTLKGNTSQTGTPTPTTPIPVNVVSGDNEINVVGKNLFKASNGTFTRNGITATINDDIITLNGTATANVYLVITSNEDRYFHTFSGNYTISKITEATNVGSALYGTDSGGTDRAFLTINDNASTKTQAINETYTSIRAQLNIPNGATYNNTIVKIQLEKGSQATSYEPYQGNTYNIDLPEGMELCSSKDGTLRDYFLHDKPLDKWYLHKEIGKVVLDGSSDEIWTKSGATTENSFVGAFNLVTTGISNKWATGSSWLCDKFVYGSLGVDYKFNTYNGDATQGYIFFGITIPISLAGDINAFRTWLGNNNVTLYYVLKEPIATEITDATLKSQLEALRNAESYEGQTNISQTNNDLPFIISASALKKWSE